MSQNTTPATRMAFEYGQCVSYADMISEQSANRQQIGSGISTQQGRLNARPLLQPLAVTTNGTMQVTIGGSNQRVLCDGYLCDGCQAQPFTVPTAPASGTRLDAICIQANPGNTVVGTVDREIEDAEGNKSQQPVNQVNDGLNYQYVQGDTSGNPPAAPAGYNRYAIISVAANATVIMDADITIDATVFPDMNPQGPQGPNPLSDTNGVISIPAIGQNANVPAVNGAAYPNGAYVTVSDGTHAIYGQIIAGGTTNTLTVNVLEIPLSAVGQQIASGATIAFSGPPGETGAAGNTGADGPEGPAGQDGKSPVFRGAWQPGTAYSVLDFVSYNGSSYGAVAASTGVQPDTDNGSHWALLASKGAQGNPGANGTTGPKGDKGDQGNPGNPGADGAPGKNAYSNTTAPVAIPALNAAASVPVSNPTPFPYGSYVVISDGSQAFFGQVTQNTGASPIAVKNLQTIAQGTGTVGAGATVSPSGPLPNVIPVGGTLPASGNGGNPSITLPNYGEWHLELIYGLTQTSNDNAQLTLSIGAGSVTNFGTNANGTQAFNSNAWITLYAMCDANGSQTVRFTLTVSHGTLSASPSQPWTIRATRTA